MLKCRRPAVEQEAHLWRIGQTASQVIGTSSCMAQWRTRCLKACLAAGADKADGSAGAGEVGARDALLDHPAPLALGQGGEQSVR